MYQPKYRFVAFDMDGTLLDSMRQYRSGPVDYLEELGLQELADEHREEMMFLPTPISKKIVSEWCVERGFPPFSREKEFEYLRQHYATDVTLKPGVRGFLELLKKHGVRMCILTATPHELCDEALRVAGIDEYFEFVLTTKEDCPCGKDNPEAFQVVLDRFGIRPEECAMVEDAEYSIRTAKELGMYIIAMEEACSAKKRDVILEMADEYYTEFPQE